MSALFIALALWTSPAVTEPPAEGVAAVSDQMSADIQNMAERESIRRSSEDGACEKLIDVLCDRTSPRFCERVKRERDKRPLTEDDERQCRDLLDDRDKLTELLKGLPQR